MSGIAHVPVFSRRSDGKGVNFLSGYDSANACPNFSLPVGSEVEPDVLKLRRDITERALINCCVVLKATGLVDRHACSQSTVMRINLP